jgi:hypothetical protein
MNKYLILALLAVCVVARIKPRYNPYADVPANTHAALSPAVVVFDALKNTNDASLYSDYQCDYWTQTSGACTFTADRVFSGTDKQLKFNATLSFHVHDHSSATVEVTLNDKQEVSHTVEFDYLDLEPTCVVVNNELLIQLCSSFQYSHTNAKNSCFGTHVDAKLHFGPMGQITLMPSTQLSSCE